VLAHFDVFLQFFDLAILELAFQLGLAVLALKLLHEERFEVVGLLTHGRVHSLVEIVLLLLQGASQVFDVFLFLLKVYVHLLGLGPQPRVFVPSNVVLDLQVAVHIPEFLFLCLSKNGCLIGLERTVLLRLELTVILSASVGWLCHLRHS